MSDILVVKVNRDFSACEMERIRQMVNSQRKSGVVVLPSYCDAQVVPDGVKIVFEEDKQNEQYNTD